MNGLSIVLLFLIAGYSVLTGIYIYRRKKKGRSCNGNCSGCSKSCR